MDLDFEINLNGLKVDLDFESAKYALVLKYHPISVNNNYVDGGNWHDFSDEWWMIMEITEINWLL